MPLTSIVSIVLRLFSLSWLVQGAFNTAGAAAMTIPYGSPSGSYWAYGAPAIYLVAAVITWLLAPTIARLVAPQPDVAVGIGGLTRYDLYCFAFVFLGLYFVLSSLGNAINWLHYYLFLAKAIPTGNPQRETSFYQLTQPLITLFAGSVCVALSSRLARKLTDAQRKDDATGH